MADGEVLKTRITLTDNISNTIENIIKNARQLEEQMETLDNVVSDFEDASINIDTSQAAEQLEEIAGIGGQAAETVEQFGTTAKDTKEDVDDFAKNSTEVMNQLGTVVTSLGIAATIKKIGDSMLEASEKAAVFETAVAKISTVADKNVVSMGKVRSDIINLSAETGRNVNELSEATYQAISASVDSAKAVEFAGTATKLAIGGFTEAATAVDVVTTALNAYGLGAEKAENVSDMLVTTQNLGKTSVDQLAQSVGKVIPLAAAFNVEMDNLSAAYAQLTKGGIATAESGTYLKSMLTELGSTSSVVGQTLIDVTGKSFNVLAQEGYSLGDVMEILGQAVDNDTVKFSALWSSQEAGVGALSLLNAGADEFNKTLETMENSAGATSDAYETMTDTTEHARVKMVNATENIANAIGDDLNPVLKILYNTGADAFNWMADVIEEYPAISASIAGVTTAFSIMGAAFAVFGLKTLPQVKTAIDVFTKALSLNPYTKVLVAIGAVTGALVGIVTWAASATEKTEKLTAASQKQADEIDRLEAQYKNYTNEVKVNSTEAAKLKTEIDELSTAFETNKQTVGDLFEETDRLVSKNEELISQFDSSIGKIADETTQSVGLAIKLSELAAKTNLTAAEQQEMQGIISKLNKDFPELATNYSGTASSAAEYADVVKEAARNQAQLNRAQETVTHKVNLEANIDAIKEQIEALENQKTAYSSTISYDITTDLEGNVVGNMFENSNITAIDDDIKLLTETLNGEEKALKSVNAEYAAMQAQIEQAASEATSSSELLKIAGEQAAMPIENLREVYNEAYSAAQTSIQGQIGLFNEVKAQSDLTVDQMVQRWQEQSEYMLKYQENLKKATELGLDPGLVQELSDGTQESAGYLNQIVAEAEKAGGATSEVVKNLNEAYGKQQEVLSGFADAAASVNQDVKDAFDNVVTVMETSINNMNTTDKLKQEALNGIGGYVSGLVDSKGLSDVSKGAETVVESAIKPLDDADTTPQGENIDYGLINGMENVRNKVVAKAKSIVDDVADIMNVTLEIHSPSKRTMWTGEMVGLGFGEGMENTFGYVKNTAKELGEYGFIGFTPEQQEYLLSGKKSETVKNKNDTNIVIDMSGVQVTVTKEADIDNVVEYITTKLAEQLRSTCEGVC